jgi:hypothetical protein
LEEKQKEVEYFNQFEYLETFFDCRLPEKYKDVLKDYILNRNLYLEKLKLIISCNYNVSFPTYRNKPDFNIIFETIQKESTLASMILNGWTMPEFKPPEKYKKIYAKKRKEKLG